MLDITKLPWNPDDWGLPAEAPTAAPEAPKAEPNKANWGRTMPALFDGFGQVGQQPALQQQAPAQPQQIVFKRKWKPIPLTPKLSGRRQR